MGACTVQRPLFSRLTPRLRSVARCTGGLPRVARGTGCLLGRGTGRAGRLAHHNSCWSPRPSNGSLGLGALGARAAVVGRRGLAEPGLVHHGDRGPDVCGCTRMLLRPVPSARWFWEGTIPVAHTPSTLCMAPGSLAVALGAPIPPRPRRPSRGVVVAAANRPRMPPSWCHAGRSTGLLGSTWLRGPHPFGCLGQTTKNPHKAYV